MIQYFVVNFMFKIGNIEIKNNIVLDLLDANNNEIDILLSSHYSSDYYKQLLDKPSVIVLLNLIN